MAEVNVAALSRLFQQQQIQSRATAPEPVGRAQEVAASDPVQLSSEAKKRLEQQQGYETVAQAFLKHQLTKQIDDANASNSENDLKDKDAQKQLKIGIDKVSMDIGWLIDALGLAPEEKKKVAEVLGARASLDYVNARPPVPFVIERAASGDEAAAVFVHDLSFTVEKDTIKDISIQKVAVALIDKTLADQLSDPETPRLVRVTQSDEAGKVKQDSDRQFHDPFNVSSRLSAAQATAELRGMLIVRDNATPQAVRLRIDALQPL